MTIVVSSAPITRTMRGLTVFTGLAVLSAFSLLFIFGEHTHRLFAWTIDPPAAAAFLGAGYGSIVLSSILSLRAKTWAQIRVPVTVLIVGLVFILLATLLHLDRFHWARAEFVPRNVAWGWIVLYGSIPPLLVWGVVGQFRAGTVVRPSHQPLPTWAWVIYAAIAIVTGVVGVGLFIAPATVAAIWFWPLTPLLARMTAAWLIGVCSAAALVLVDNHVGHSRIAALTLIAYAVLQCIVLARYAAVVRWTMPMAWIWVAVLALTLLVNVWVWRSSETNEE